MGRLINLMQSFAAGLDVSGLPGAGAKDPGSAQLQNVLNIVFAICGAVAVMVVVLAGVRFILSRGNPSETARARNAIIFASVGLAIVLLASSIVNFVVFRAG